MELEELKLQIGQLLTDYDFMIRTPQMSLDKLRVSYSSAHKIGDQFFGIDIDAEIRSSMCNEMTHGILKGITSQILSSVDLDYIEITGIDMDWIFPSVLSDRIASKDYKNMIVSSKIGANIQDLGEYSYLASSPQTTRIISPIGLNRMGKFHNIDVWVDPYMRYNDSRILFFDNVYYNSGEIKYISDPIGHISTRDTLEFSFKSQVDRSMVLYVVGGPSDPNYGEYLRVTRDRKIDDLVK